ncbi:MAG TPA: PIN domain-containing protein [Solirubrobacteraceae bacterium]|nr:PIN domain-containing protein [Solirubrobacteraceae bacterium]
MSVLLDAFALIALLAEEPAADEVEALLRRGEAAITAVNLAEALDVLQRVQEIPRDRLEAVTRGLVGERMTLVPIDERIARDAADIRARRYHRTRAPVSLADCILVAATGESDALATADGPLIRVARAEGVQVRELSR